MGIWKLTNFIKYNVPLYRAKLEDFQVVVIDGNNLYAKLHRKYVISWEMGGEYPQFYDEVKTFMQAFIDADVKPVIVMDGLTEPNTEQKRKESKLRQYKELSKNNGIDSPLFRCQIFIDAIVDLKKQKKVELYVAAGEGDRATAALANFYKCPVLSDDSDFFMYDLKCGMIPYSSLNIETQTCSLYTITLLQKQFDLLDPLFRLLIPAVHGNDYLENTINPSERVRPTFSQTLKEASGHHSVSNYLHECSRRVRENFKAASDQYSNLALPPDANFKSTISCHDLPPWVFEAYKEGNFHPFLLNVKRDRLYITPSVVEDVSQESAWLCGRDIRRHMYGFMGMLPDSDITEVVRKASSVDIDEQSTTPIISDLSLNIYNFSEMPIKARKLLVLNVLTCYKSFPIRLQTVFNKLENKWQLPVAATAYWYHRSGRAATTEHLLKALLLCFLYCSNKIECQLLPSPTKSMANVHSLAQWQCVYHDTLALNCLAKECFHSTSPALLYSGELVMSFAACDTRSLQQGSIHVPLLYYKILEIITFKAK